MLFMYFLSNSKMVLIIFPFTVLDRMLQIKMFVPVVGIIKHIDQLHVIIVLVTLTRVMVIAGCII